MKKRLIILFALIILSTSVLVACEKSTEIRAASISEVTMAGSKNFGVKVCYLEDKRLKGKGTDVQIKFNKLGTIIIWQEGKDKFEYEIKDFDEWQSMTNIISQAYNSDKKVTFEKFEDAINKTYLFNYDSSMKVTLRVVEGDIEDSSDGSGQILVGSHPISDNFTLNIK